MSAYIFSLVAIVIALAALLYAGHCAIVFQRFNDGIKDWASSLDDSMNSAIQRSARSILIELDKRISESNEKVESLNDVNYE